LPGIQFASKITQGEIRRAGNIPFAGEYGDLRRRKLFQPRISLGDGVIGESTLAWQEPVGNAPVQGSQDRRTSECDTTSLIEAAGKSLKGWLSIGKRGYFLPMEGCDDRGWGLFRQFEFGKTADPDAGKSGRLLSSGGRKSSPEKGMMSP
jgi:hypothetical protein